MLEKLKGYRTYLIALLVGILAMAQHLGIIDGQIYLTLMGLLGATGLSTLRAGITNSK